MKHRAIALFLVGLILEFAAFFKDQAVNFPFLLRVIAPRHFCAQAGLQQILAGGTLSPGQKGFEEIDGLLMARMREVSDPEMLRGLTIQMISKGHPSIGFGPNKAEDRLPIFVHLSNGLIRGWDIAPLRERIDSLQSKNLFRYALVLFFLGAFFQCLGFYLDYKGSSQSIKEL